MTLTQAHRPCEALESHAHAVHLFEALGAWDNAARTHERLARIHESLDDPAAAASACAIAARSSSGRSLPTSKIPSYPTWGPCRASAAMQNNPTAWLT
ncbi:hypothetical protein ACFC00_31185 [Streptomyces adustus]|uniref:hypothetical protein n=1 Tax=Streptomyces adustus TaxID=1609272 RepID=UPI0035D56388